MVTTFNPGDRVLVTSKHNPEISFKATVRVVADKMAQVIVERHSYAQWFAYLDWAITLVEPPLVLPVGTVVEWDKAGDPRFARATRTAVDRWFHTNGDEAAETDDDIRAAIKSGEARVVPVEELEQEARR